MADSQMSAIALEDFDPLDPASLRCPHAGWALLRRESPVHPMALPGADIPIYLVTRKEEIKYVCQRPDLFSNTPPICLFRWGDFEAEVAEAFSSVSEYNVVHTLQSTDPPDAQRFRKIISKFISVKTVKEIDDLIRAVIVRLVASLPLNEEFDFVKQFAERMPLEVICHVLDLPLDWEMLLEYTENHMVLTDAVSPPEAAVKAAAKVAKGYNYLAKHVKAARAAPRDGLLSAYANARFDDGELFPIEEAISMVSATLLAGNETTRDAISTIMFELAKRPKTWDRLRADPALIPEFVEEALRLNAPVNTTMRTVREDTELAGVKLSKGSALCLIWGSGSRDEEVFDSPDELWIDRANKRSHTTFGLGLHHCAGSSLARVELAVTVEEFTKRFERLQLAAPPEQIAYLPTFMNRSLHHLPLVGRG